MSDTERRDFYRMEDRVHLIRTPVEKHLISEDPYGDQYNIPRQALLISKLQSIDNDSRDLLRQVGDYNRALGSYLRAMDEKIELLTQYVVSHDKDLARKEPVNLSEGGISFYEGAPLTPGSFLHLIIVLFPTYTSIAAIGEVKTCEKVDEQPVIYRVGVEFQVLLEADRKLIVRHIRRRQSQAIREQGQKSD
ncbi:MAG TPA: PilZ domain-containing protein [Dongiaceae bacterium]|nr:PilZ domain-containing protein [Dongiaceae bacterium]